MDKKFLSRFIKGIISIGQGYRDSLVEAFPILSHYGFTATVFLVTERVGMESNWGDAIGFPLIK